MSRALLERLNAIGLSFDSRLTYTSISEKKVKVKVLIKQAKDFNDSCDVGKKSFDRDVSLNQQRYIAGSKPETPVVLWLNEDKELRIANGNRRVLAAAWAQEEYIDAVIFEGPKALFDVLRKGSNEVSGRATHSKEFGRELQEVLNLAGIDDIVASFILVYICGDNNFSRGGFEKIGEKAILNLGIENKLTRNQLVTVGQNFNSILHLNEFSRAHIIEFFEEILPKFSNEHGNGHYVRESQDLTKLMFKFTSTPDEVNQVFKYIKNERPDVHELLHDEDFDLSDPLDRITAATTRIEVAIKEFEDSTCKYSDREQINKYRRRFQDAGVMLFDFSRILDI